MGEKYGIIESQFSVRDLLKVPHKKNQILYVSSPAFGPNICFSDSIENIQKKLYLHPKTGEKILFRAPTTTESISAAAWKFGERAKPQIFDSRKPISWLHLGYVIWISEGGFVNPPKYKNGETMTNEKTLKSFLNKSKKVNGIWLYEGKDARDFGFVPYETFEEGLQEAGKFAESGLARVLEHTKEKEAKNFKEIASPKFYKNGVNVHRYGKVGPVLNTVNIFSGKMKSDCDKLIVDCTWGDDYMDLFSQEWDKGDGGYAFWVLKLNSSGGI